MAEENINNYLNCIQKMIRSGNPKYMSYISKEYMKYKDNSPVISETIESMIRKSVNINPQSPYAVFLDKDGTISLESIDNISKISNLPEFVSQVQELSKYGIDFSSVTSEDLIIEGDEMAEELARELEDAENMTEEQQKDLAGNAGKTVAQLTGLALIGGTIGSKAKGILDRIKQSLAKLMTRKPKQESKESEETEAEKSRLEKIETAKRVMASEKSFEDVCPRHDVDEEKALNPDKEKGSDGQKIQNNDTYGDGDPDGDDLNI